MRSCRPRIDVNPEELDQIIDRGRQAPLSESDGRKLKATLHAMAERLSSDRSTEKTRAVLNSRRLRPQHSRQTMRNPARPGMAVTAPLNLRARAKSLFHMTR